MASLVKTFKVLTRTSRSNDAKGKKECQKTIGFTSKTTTLHVHHTCLYISLLVFFTITIKKCLIYRFMEHVNNERRNSISLSELGYAYMVPRNSTPEGFAYIWKSKWVGVIVIKTEKTKIHYLSDVLVAVASFDLKVPIYSGALAREAR